MDKPTHARAYLSVLSWPDGFSHDDRVEALVAAAGMDVRLAELESRVDPPAVVGEIDALLGPEILRVLHERGVLALAPSEDEFALYPEPEPVKRLVRFPGTRPASFAVDDNDEPAWTFTARDLRLVVFGRTRASSVEIRADRRTWRHQQRFGASAQDPDSFVTRSERVESEEVLDLHLMHGGGPRLLRLTGQRALIRCLDSADERPSLLERATPLGLLEPHIPGVKIDTGFAGFQPPLRTRMGAVLKGQGSRRLSPEAFGFYSVWCALNDRALRGW